MDGFFDFFEKNPNLSGLVITAIGVLLFIGAVFQWEWVLRPHGSRWSIIRGILGARGQIFIYSTVLVIAGIAMFIFI